MAISLASLHIRRTSYSVLLDRDVDLKIEGYFLLFTLVYILWVA